MPSHLKNVIKPTLFPRKTTIANSWFFDPWYYVETNTATNPGVGINNLFVLGWRHNYSYYNWDNVNTLLVASLRSCCSLVQQNYIAIFLDQRAPVHNRINRLLTQYNYPILFPEFAPGMLTNKKIAQKGAALSNYSMNFPTRAFLVIFDSSANSNILFEARAKNIPVFCVGEANSNYIDFLIPSSKKGQFSSLHFFIDTLVTFIINQKKLSWKLCSGATLRKPIGTFIKRKLVLSTQRKSASLMKTWTRKTKHKKYGYR